MLNRNGKRGYPVLFFILEEMLSAFTIEYDVSCRFVTNDLHYVEICCFYTNFAESFS